MTATRANIDAVTSRNEQAMLWVVVVATLLDQLAAEQPADRVPFFPGGRDEVNLMAGSVNAMADHKAGFIDWWKAIMREADACERLQELMQLPQASDERREVEEELRQAVLAKEDAVLATIPLAWADSCP